MRLPEMLQKIKDFRDLPKDIFILLVILLVGIGSFALGRMSTFEEQRRENVTVSQSALSGHSGLSANALSAVGEKPAFPLESKTTFSTPTREVGEVTGVVGTIKGAYVASKTGAVFYAPWCGGVKRIKEENKVWFESKEAAVSKGYRPAENCKGM